MSEVGKKEKITPRIRWMIRSDLPQVLDIEHDSFEKPWSKEKLGSELRKSNCIGMVAAIEDERFKAGANTLTQHLFSDFYNASERKKIITIISKLLDFNGEAAIKPEEEDNALAFELAVTKGLQNSLHDKQNGFDKFLVKLKSDAKGLLKNNQVHKPPTIHNDRVLGYMVYELNLKSIHLLKFAVDPEFRRAGVGKALIDRLVDKLSYDRRNKIVFEVPETNLPAQKFFKAMGFRATGVLEGHFEDTHEDAYRMEYLHEKAQETNLGFADRAQRKGPPEQGLG